MALRARGACRSDPVPPVGCLEEPKGQVERGGSTPDAETRRVRNARSCWRRKRKGPDTARDQLHAREQSREFPPRSRPKEILDTLQPGRRTSTAHPPTPPSHPARFGSPKVSPTVGQATTRVTYERLTASPHPIIRRTKNPESTICSGEIHPLQVRTCLGQILCKSSKSNKSNPQAAHGLACTSAPSLSKLNMKSARMRLGSVPLYLGACPLKASTLNAGVKRGGRDFILGGLMILYFYCISSGVPTSPGWPSCFATFTVVAPRVSVRLDLFVPPQRRTATRLIYSFDSYL